MPWKETGPVIERHSLLRDHLSGVFSKAELARRYGVSRKSVHKWIKRFEALGAAGLQDVSRKPRTSPRQISPAVVKKILALRRRHPHRGPKKLVVILERQYPGTIWPAPSTVGDILRRNGMIEERPHRRAGMHPLSTAPLAVTGASQRTTADFKGQFRLRSGQYCYPLTIVDAFSHFILACEALPSTEYELTRAVFERVFREYGLPLRLLTDNGSPFASTGLGRLSQLNVWWMRLGIVVERIWPGRPDQNGSHERMHRELKRETTRPPEATLAAQQKVFNRFTEDYNVVRPHEALGQRTPASHFSPSARSFPKKLQPLEYPGHFETRKADHKGMISWRGRKIFLASPLAGQDLGFEEVDEGLWCIHFASSVIGRFDERTSEVHG